MSGFLKRRKYQRSFDEWLTAFGLDPSIISTDSKQIIVRSAMATGKWLDSITPPADLKRDRALGHDPVEVFLKQGARVLSFCCYGPTEYESISDAQLRAAAEEDIERAFKDGSFDPSHNVGKVISIAISSGVINQDFLKQLETRMAT